MYEIVKLLENSSCYLYGLAKTMMEPKFHVSIAKNNNVVDNEFLILPKHVILMYQIVNLDKTQLF